MKDKIPKIALGILGLAGLTLAVIGIAMSGSGGGGASSQAGGPSAAPEPAPTGGHLTEQPAQIRTLLVSTGTEPAPSSAGQTLNALRIKGPVPKAVGRATVLTDEDCAPDASGVSHCINRLRLASGKTLIVRHPHRMMEVPCLSPGEHIKVGPA